MNNKGLIKAVIVIIVALIVLGYFGFNIKDIINGPVVQDNLHTAWSFVSMIWTKYLSGPVVFIFGKIWHFIQPAK